MSLGLQQFMSIRLTERKASELLSTLCIKLGFCLIHKTNSCLVNNPPPSAERFVNAIYSMEWLDSSLCSDLYKQVVSYVETAFQRHLDQADYKV
jgi:hypothetical protein